jgi:Flp pilus assembly protein TadD
MDAVQKIGKYEIQAELGQGGFGRVYRAFDPTVGRPVAIKILTTEGPDLLTRFRNEASAAGNLKHRNIVTVYDFGEYNGRPYLVMEFLEGEDLLQVINRGVKLTLLEKMHIMDQVADGLDCAHRNNVIHRDIKPANIRLLPDGTVKIMDFGVARVKQDREATRLTQQGDLIGTILYMSPEQFGGAEADSLSDIFAYGVTYFELLTGKHPFYSSDPRTVMYKITMEEPEAVRNLAADCPEGLDQILSRALQKDRELRYQNLRDLKLDVEPLILELQRNEATGLILEARELSSGTDIRGALQKVNQALKLDPTNRDARQFRDVIQRQLQKQALLPRIESMLQAAEELVAIGAFSRAVQTLQSAARLDQTDPRIQALLKTAREDLQRTNEAARLAMMALADLDEGDFSAAEEKASEAARLHPANINAARVIAAVEKDRSVLDLLIRAEALIDQGDLGTAIHRFEEAIGLRPQSKEIQKRLVDVALRTVSERIREAPDNSQDFVNRSELANAIEFLNLALTVVPQNESILALRARAEERLLAQKRAADIDLAAQEAESLLSVEKFDEAIQSIRCALDAFPDERKLTSLAERARASKAAWQHNIEIQNIMEQSARLVGENRLANAIEAIDAGLRQFGPEQRLEEKRYKIQEQLHEQRVADAGKKAEEARALLAGGHADQAVALLESACEEFPEEPHLSEILTQAREEIRLAQRRRAMNEVSRQCAEFASRTRYGEALEVIQAALTQYGDEPLLIQLQANIQNQWRQQQRAESALQIAEKGRVLLGQDVLEAMRFLDSAVAEFPEQEHLKDLLSEVQQRVRAQQRRETVEAAVRDSQASAQQKEYARAQEILETALKAWPGDPQLLDLLQRMIDARAWAQREKELAELIQRGEQLAREQCYREALEAVQAGLVSYHNDSALLQLHQTIQEQWTRQQRVESSRQSAEDGRGLLARGDLDQALEVLRRAAVKDPDDWQLRELLADGEQQLQVRRRKQAVEAALSESAASAGRQDFSCALKILEKALDSWPGERGLLDRLEETMESRAQWERHKAVAEIVRRCEQLLGESRHREALGAIAAGLVTYENEPTLTKLQEQAREQLEVQERAEAVLRLAQAGEQLMEQGRVYEAVELLERAVAQYAEDEQLDRLLEKAQQAFQIEQRVRAVDAAAEQAETLWAKRDLAGAVNILDQALTEWPAQGRLEDLLRDIKEDQAQWQRRQEIDKLAGECERLRREQRLEEAIVRIQADLEWLGEDAILVELLRDLEEQVARQRRNLAIRRLVEEGEWLLQSGFPEEALHVFESATAEYPGEEVLAQGLAKANTEVLENQRKRAIEAAVYSAAEYMQVGEYSAALEILDRALESWPDEGPLVKLREEAIEAKAEGERQNAIREIVRECERLAREGRYSEALAPIEAGISQFGEQTAFLQLRQQLQREWEREQAVNQASNDANQLLENDQPEKAVEVLEKASSDYQGEDRLRQLLAFARKELEGKRRREAVESAAREAEACAAQKDFDRALKLLKKALKSWPHESRLLELRRKVKEDQTVWAQRQLAVSVSPESEASLEPQPRDRNPLARQVPWASVRKSERLILYGIAAAVLLAAGASVLIPGLRRPPRGVRVSITANIGGASVKIGDLTCVTPDCSLRLPAGLYQLAATKAGYRSVSQAFSVKSGGTELKIPLVLQPLPEILQVNTNFASGKVFFDKKPGGELRDGQLSFSDVGAGQHVVRVTSGDADFDVEFRSAPGVPPEITRPLSARNVQATVVANAGDTGSVACNCDVSTIQVDGKPVAFAGGPRSVLALHDLKEGARRISAADRSLLVDVRPNPSLNIQLALDRNVGTLMILAGEDGARVLLNGRPYPRVTERGTLRIPTDIGEYTIKVQKEGFSPSKPQKITLSKGEEKQVSFILAPLPSALEISRALPGAAVKVDGRGVGEIGSDGRLTAEVSPGTHEIEITKNDYAPARFSAQFTAGARIRTTPEQIAMNKIIPQPPPSPEHPDPKQIEAEEWDRVRGSNNPQELDDFVRRHPGGAHQDEARERSARLRQQLQADAARRVEQTVWDAADKTKKAALQDFLSRFGSGAHAEEARALVGEIEKREADSIAAQRAKEDREQEQGVRVLADEQSIARSLSAFESAYNAKDLQALRAAWPSMPKNTGDELGAQFRYAKSLMFRIRQSAPPVIMGNFATVPCTRALDLTTRDGQKVASGNERVRVTLERTGSGWLIRSIVAN